MTNYLLAGGGTAGHVNPLLALAELISETEPESSVLALGTAEGLEARLVPQRGFELATIAKLPFPRKPSLYALKFPAAYKEAVNACRKIIVQRRIDVVVGFGGYAAAPAYTAARKEGIPYVIHEANAKPGLANRLGARNTDYVAVTFPETPIRSAHVTGMPLRREITQLDRAANREVAAGYFQLDPHKPTLLVTGGSLGAKALNEAVAAAAAEVVNAGAQILHVWGGLNEIKAPTLAGYEVLAYCDRMELAFSVADLVLTRAGSTTVSEIAGLGIPAVFSPYSYGNGEQALNCRSAVATGGALQVTDNEISGDWIVKTMLPLLLDKQKLQSMSAALRTAGSLEGTQNLLQLVKQALAQK